MDLFTRIQQQFERLVMDAAITIDGTAHSGLPHRATSLEEITRFLHSSDSSREARDSLWHAFAAAPDREVWDTICLGIALPALHQAVARAVKIWPHDPDGLQSTAVSAFLAKLPQHAANRGCRIFAGLYTHVKSACRTYARDMARHTRGAAGQVFDSRPPVRPWGHVDLVLAEAIREEVVTQKEAIIIATARLMVECQGAFHRTRDGLS